MGAIKIRGETLTLRRILMNMRTSIDPDTCIFSQINSNYRGKAIVVCHENEKDETQILIEFLYVFLKAQFNDQVSHWFDLATINQAEGLSFDEESGKIIDKAEENLEIEYTGRFI